MKRRVKQNAWGNWYGYQGRSRVIEFGTNESAAREWEATGNAPRFDPDTYKIRIGERKENPMKHFRPPFHVDFHSERGEVSIYVTDRDDNEVWYGDDQTVRELIEDGFIDAKGFIMGRNARPEVLERSVIAYLRSVGVIPADEGFGQRGVNVYEDNVDLYDDSRSLDFDREPSRFDADGRDLSKPWPRRNNPCGRRRNPGDIHIDIQSHNTRGGGSVRARNPRSEKHWVIQWFNEDHPVEPMWMEYTSFEDTHDGAMETLEAIQRKSPDKDFRLAEDRVRARYNNPTQDDVNAWTDHYRASLEKRVDGIPAKTHYVVKITTNDGEEAWLRVGKGSKFDTDIAKARVYRNGDKANEAATKVLNWLKKKAPAKAKKIKSISAEPKK